MTLCCYYPWRSYPYYCSPSYLPSFICKPQTGNRFSTTVCCAKPKPCLPMCPPPCLPACPPPPPNVHHREVIHERPVIVKKPSCRHRHHRRRHHRTKPKARSEEKRRPKIIIHNETSQSKDRKKSPCYVPVPMQQPPHQQQKIIEEVIQEIPQPPEIVTENYLTYLPIGDNCNGPVTTDIQCIQNALNQCTIQNQQRQPQMLNLSNCQPVIQKIEQPGLLCQNDNLPTGIINTISANNLITTNNCNDGNIPILITAQNQNIAQPPPSQPTQYILQPTQQQRSQQPPIMQSVQMENNVNMIPMEQTNQNSFVYNQDLAASNSPCINNNTAGLNPPAFTVRRELSGKEANDIFNRTIQTKSKKKVERDLYKRSMQNYESSLSSNTSSTSLAESEGNSRWNWKRI
ncbi:hypothetical protein SNEBB_001148 [Seison nebaliae]|nr:hypothetical protein SNEBB_001148 [Seison nebaliae]